MRLFIRSLCFPHRSLLSQLPRVLRRKVTTATAAPTPDIESELFNTNIPPPIPKIIAKVPKLIISPGSKHHNSLPSFLEYAAKRGLEPTKTVYVGTHYEYISALSLLRLGFSLLRTGRRADAGIDLIGHWVLPNLPEPLPVIVQCKVRQRCLGPEHLRELEGAFRSVPPDWRKKAVIGLLVNTEYPTRGMLKEIGTNPRPMGFVKLTRTGIIEQFVWNRSAIERGLQGVGVTIRHKPRALLSEAEIAEQGGEGGGWKIPKQTKGKPVGGKAKGKKMGVVGTRRDIQLTWLGKPMFPDREGLDEETLRLMGVIEEGVRAEGEKPKRGRGVKGKEVVEKTVKGVMAKAKIVNATVTTATAKRIGRPPKVAVLAPKKRGRPPGSKNKRVEDTAKKYSS